MLELYYGNGRSKFLVVVNCSSEKQFYFESFLYFFVLRFYQFSMTLFVHITVGSICKYLLVFTFYSDGSHFVVAFSRIYEYYLYGLFMLFILI